MQILWERTLLLDNNGIIGGTVGVSMGEGQYYWAVLCKNRRFHRQQNLFFAHKIPLAETDAFLPPPSFNTKLHVRCDDCGQEYSYEPKELVRIQLDYPEPFTPHPLFDT